MKFGTFAKLEGLVLIKRKTESKQCSQYLLQNLLLLLSVIVVWLSTKVNNNQIRWLVYQIQQYNSYWMLSFHLLWFYTLNQMRIKNVLMSVWIKCSMTEGKSSFSISGKHEFRWCSANGSTLKLLRRKYLSCSFHSATRSHFLKSLQTYLQSNISFMSNHPCLWKHMRKVSIQLKSSPITIPMVVWLQWF